MFCNTVILMLLYFVEDDNASVDSIITISNLFQYINDNIFSRLIDGDNAISLQKIYFYT